MAWGSNKKKPEENNKKGGTPPKKKAAPKGKVVIPKTVAPKVTGTGPKTHTYTILSTKPGHAVLRREGCNCSLNKSHMAYETPPEPGNA